jgi:hypothetical protein
MTINTALVDRVRGALDRKGLLKDGRQVLWSRWNGTGWRISILRPMKGSTTIEEKSVTVAALRGSERDQANGITGRFLANY